MRDFLILAAAVHGSQGEVQAIFCYCSEMLPPVTKDAYSLSVRSLIRPGKQNQGSVIYPLRERLVAAAA